MEEEKGMKGIIKEIRGYMGEYKNAPKRYKVDCYILFLSTLGIIITEKPTVKGLLAIVALTANHRMNRNMSDFMYLVTKRLN